MSEKRCTEKSGSPGLDDNEVKAGRQTCGLWFIVYTKCPREGVSILLLASVKSGLHFGDYLLIKCLCNTFAGCSPEICATVEALEMGHGH